MKTLTKTEAVRAFLDGKRVEYRKFEKWHAVKSYSVFDQDLSFRIAATDEDAEWLRKSATLEIRQTQSEYYEDAVRVADRIERDKARISELERWKSEMLEVENEWDEQAVGLELGMTLGMPIRKNIMPYIKSMKVRISELEELNLSLQDKVTSLEEYFSGRDDKANEHIAELEEKSSTLKSEHLAMCNRLQDTVQKYKLGLGGEKIDQIVCDRIAELEAEVARLKPDESKKPWTSIEYVSEPPAKGGDK